MDGVHINKTVPALIGRVVLGAPYRRTIIKTNDIGFLVFIVILLVAVLDQYIVPVLLALYL